MNLCVSEDRVYLCACVGEYQLIPLSVNLQSMCWTFLVPPQPLRVCS